MPDVFLLLTDLGPLHAYLLIFTVLLLCGFGVPIPEDITILAAGYLCYEKVISFPIALILTFAAVLIGDAVIFGIGRRMGPNIQNSRFGRFLSKPKRKPQIKYFLDRYGNKVTILARFMPGLRAPIFLLLGSLNMRFLTFLIYDGLAALFSVPLILFVGYRFGEEINLAIKWVRKSEIAIIAVILVVILYLGISFWLRSRRKFRSIGKADFHH